MVDLNFILAQKESEWLDFKREFHSNNADLLHDILCLANSNFNGDRYLIFGVSNDKTIYGVRNDKNKKTNADLHDFLRQVRLNKIPLLELTFQQYEGHQIGILQITNSPAKPYFILQDYQRGKTLVRAGVVYTRLRDTNIPCNETAPEYLIEQMWQERIESNNIESQIRFHNDLKKVLHSKPLVIERMIRSKKQDEENWRNLHELKFIKRQNRNLEIEIVKSTAVEEKNILRITFVFSFNFSHHWQKPTQELLKNLMDDLVLKENYGSDWLLIDETYPTKHFFLRNI